MCIGWCHAGEVSAAIVPVDVLVLSPRVARDDLHARAVRRNRDDFELVASMRRAYDINATGEVDGQPLRDWLVTEARLTPSSASRHIYLVHRLAEFPATESAFAAGQITLDHAYAIVKALRSVHPDVRPTLEPQLLEIADTESPIEITRLMDRLLEALGHDKDSEVARERRQGDRYVRVVDTLGRTGDLRGLLMPETRTKLATALQRAAHKTGPDDERTPAQRAHDALDEILDIYLAHDEEPSFAGAPRSVMVLIPLEVLEDRLATANSTLLPTGAQIGPETARRLACDAEVIPAVLGSRSEVLDLGRAARCFNSAVRRAAWLEQQGCCAFPGCKRRPSECHHVVWWSAGGRTSLDNAAWLCAYHHWLAHEGRWKLRKKDGHSFTWTSPDGGEKTRHLLAA